MKTHLMAVCLLISLNALADADQDQKAQGSVRTFVVTVNQYLDGINVVSHWDKLNKKISAVADQTTVQSLMNNASEASFNDSLMKLMLVRGDGMKLQLLSEAHPNVLEIIDSSSDANGATVYHIKVLDTANAIVYQTTCNGSKCTITGVQFK